MSFCDVDEMEMESSIAISRAEAPKADHPRDSVADLEKYKVVQIFPMMEDRNQEDCKFVGDVIS